MKKTVFLFVLLFTSHMVMATDTFSVSAGMDFPLFSDCFETEEDGDTNNIFSGKGISVSSYSFWNDRKIGLMANMALDFPTEYNDTKGEDHSLKNADPNLMFNGLFGFGMRTNPEKKVQLYTGFGLHFMTYEFAEDDTTITMKNFGVGLDLSMKVNLKRNMFLRFGLPIYYDFSNSTEDDRGNNREQDSYEGYWITPRIQIGYDFKK